MGGGVLISGILHRFDARATVLYLSLIFLCFSVLDLDLDLARFRFRFRVCGEPQETKP